MAITPQTEIRLLKVPFELDNKNQLTFANLQAQSNYFLNLPNIQEDNCTYQRKDDVIRFPAHIDTILQYNYVMYQNENYTNKWFYAFITNMRYVNDNVTEITIKTDVFQTWQFDIIYKNSFVEREHTNDDTIGANIIDENLNVGEYINAETPVSILDDIDNFYICMGVSNLPDDSIPPNNKNRIYNGVFSGLYLLAFKTPEDCQTAIKIYDSFAKADAIYTLFMLPKNFIVEALATKAEWSVAGVGTCEMIYIDESSGADVLDGLDMTRPNHVGKNYIPKNNKLYIYPYNFMNITNNAGTTVPFKYEDFGFEINFVLYGAITPGISMKLIPLDYKNIRIDYNSGIMGGKLPICSWNSDVYVNWLTQNAVNIGIEGASSFTNISTGNISSGINEIFSTINSVYQAELTPNQARGNINAGDINFSNEKAGFTGYYMTIKDEYAKIIDDFFSMYGYKTNSVKIPNITGRLNWNYVKTINCNLIGNIPQQDLQELKSIFDNGVTFWHNASTFLDYSQINNIL